jgi:hypothetical protein
MFSAQHTQYRKAVQHRGYLGIHYIDPHTATLHSHFVGDSRVNERLMEHRIRDLHSSGIGPPSLSLPLSPSPSPSPSPYDLRPTVTLTSMPGQCDGIAPDGLLDWNFSVPVSEAPDAGDWSMLCGYPLLW